MIDSLIFFFFIEIQLKWRWFFLVPERASSFFYSIFQVYALPRVKGKICPILICTYRTNEPNTASFFTTPSFFSIQFFHLSSVKQSTNFELYYILFVFDLSNSFRSPCFNFFYRVFIIILHIIEVVIIKILYINY